MKSSEKNISLKDCRGCAAKIPQFVLNKSLINSNLPQDNIIVSINQEITDMDAKINPDDEVAFMPMFTGG